MSFPHIIPVVLCGGKGTRLWPLSTPEKPKVFHCLTGEYSLFQETLLRCRNTVFSNRPIVVGSAMHNTLIVEQLDAIDVAADILLEPCGRNSLPAALAGALLARQRSPEAVILFLASDHFIPDVQAFVDSVVLAHDDLENRDGVVFGVEPDEPSEAFGYIQPGARIEGSSSFELSRFREKPTRAMARELVAAGWLWNSGNFLCHADRLLTLARQFAPEALFHVEQAMLAHQVVGIATCLDEIHFSLLKPQSFDRSILERLVCGAVLPVSYKWRDLGSWDAILALETEYSSSHLADVNHNC